MSRQQNAASTSQITLDEVRSQIDELDRSIVAAIAERQTWVETAGMLKPDAAAVPAPDRVERVIAKVRALAEEHRASPDVVEGAYRALIAGFIELEFAQQRARAHETPGSTTGNG
ncbi:isochorismate lyase [Leucobacter tardus]|uniref:Chorismate mutase n=1 Tax=Leucobacter tardus TaxID=501483 RepID=A0A939QCZ4_9MICO|nr:chorismate mutase [Leucobacter tardus]MBO2989885.1 chorismate mutase [Leucobacter tardus]